MYSDFPFFHRQIRKATLYVIIMGLPPHLNYVATLPFEIQKSKMTAEIIRIPTKLIRFT